MPTLKSSPGPANLPPARASRGQLAGWIIIPALIVAGLAWIATSLLGPPPALPAAGVGALAAAPTATAALVAAGGPPATRTPEPDMSLTPRDVGAPRTPTQAATFTANPAPPAPTATPDQAALALLAQLPASLPDPSAPTTALATPPPTLTPLPEATATMPPIPTDPPEPPTATRGPDIPLGPPPTQVPPATDTPLPSATLPPPPPPTVPAIADTSGGGGGPVDPLTGLAADPALITRVPLVVMIDNHPAAAPQTGLNSASMVIEALAEGGITRFETFFLTGDAPTVGPVRSARPYFVEWAYPFHPLYVHCGGSWEAIDLLLEAGKVLRDVDCFNGNMPFWRSNDRLMPHNLYSSTTQLWKMAARQGLQAPPSEPQFLHTAALPADQRPASASLSFFFSTLSRSDITWIYDHNTNQYLRKQWGYWHRDLATNEIVNARDVVVLWTNVWELPGDEKGRMGTDTTGQGTALIMHDGLFEWGYWVRKTPYTALNIYDGKWQPMRFTPGRIWMEVLSVGKHVEIGH